MTYRNNLKKRNFPVKYRRRHPEIAPRKRVKMMEHLRMKIWVTVHRKIRRIRHHRSRVISRFRIKWPRASQTRISRPRIRHFRISRGQVMLSGHGYREP
jgi:hypothetical protein